MNRDYTIQIQPAISGQGYSATIVELGETVTGSTQFDVWEAAQRVIFDAQRAALETAKARRQEQQQRRARTVA